MRRCAHPAPHPHECNYCNYATNNVADRVCGTQLNCGNSGPPVAQVLGILQILPLCAEQYATMQYVDQVNTQRCWNACHENTNTIQQLASLGKLNVEHIQMACYACNSCSDNSTLLCRLENLHEACDAWLTNVGLWHSDVHPLIACYVAAIGLHAALFRFDKPFNFDSSNTICFYCLRSCW